MDQISILAKFSEPTYITLLSIRSEKLVEQFYVIISIAPRVGSESARVSYGQKHAYARVRKLCKDASQWLESEAPLRRQSDSNILVMATTVPAQTWKTGFVMPIEKPTWNDKEFYTSEEGERATILSLRLKSL